MKTFITRKQLCSYELYEVKRASEDFINLRVMGVKIFGVFMRCPQCVFLTQLLGKAEELHAFYQIHRCSYS
jgi:hypothetical protein